jgi:hypothetical protein
MNKYFQESLALSKTPLKLTGKEEKQGKVNPERKRSILKK